MGGWGAPLLVAAAAWSLLDPCWQHLELTQDSGIVQLKVPGEREKECPPRRSKPTSFEEPTASCVVGRRSLKELPTRTSQSQSVCIAEKSNKSPSLLERMRLAPGGKVKWMPSSHPLGDPKRRTNSELNQSQEVRAPGVQPEWLQVTEWRQNGVHNLEKAAHGPRSGRSTVPATIKSSRFPNHRPCTAPGRPTAIRLTQGPPSKYSKSTYTKNDNFYGGGVTRKGGGPAERSSAMPSRAGERAPKADEKTAKAKSRKRRECHTKCKAGKVAKAKKVTCCKSRVATPAVGRMSQST